MSGNAETPDWRDTNREARYQAKATFQGVTKYERDEEPGLPDAVSALLTVAHANAFRLGHEVPLFDQDRGKLKTVALRHVGRAENALYDRGGGLVRRSAREKHNIVRRHLKRAVKRLRKDGHTIPEPVLALLAEVGVEIEQGAVA